LSVIIFTALLILPLTAAGICALTRHQRTLETVTVAVTALALGAALWLSFIILDNSVVASRNNLLYADALSSLVILIVAGSAFVTAIYSVSYLRLQLKLGAIETKDVRLYYSLFNVFLFTMMTVLLSNNLGFLWIGSEASTLATAFLVAFYEKEHSLEAAWKYIVICSVGIALALFGIILTYYSALPVVGSVSNALHWSVLITIAPKLDPAIIKLAFIFILVGFGTKAGIAPFHTWKPDAYGEAPAPISALMAGGLVNVALYSLLRFYAIVTRAVGSEFTSNLFVFFGLFSMAVALPFILLQKDSKRLLAYSSVEHVGIIIFAVGLASPLAYFGALLHMINNAIAKLVLFLTTGNLRLAYHSKLIGRISGAIKVVPATAIFYMVGIFAITGWPPFGPFVSEFSIATAGFAAGKVIPVIIFLGIIAIAFIGFIYYGSRMVFGEPHHPLPPVRLHRVVDVLLGCLVVLLLVLGTMIPPWLWILIRNAAKVLQG
jgi:hydrogenase-4 component F